MTDNQDTEKYLLDKINNGEELNESELTLLVTTFSYTVEVHLEIRTEEHERWVDFSGQVLL